MRRVSVTDLDSFLYWRDNEEVGMEELLRRLRHDDPPTAQMLAGRALHKLLETAEADSTLDAATCEGHRFLFNFNSQIALPPIRELKGEIEIKTDAGVVTLVGVVDNLDGLIISDYKLTGGYDVERYLDSMQWRCYLAMFGARRFRYEVFVGREQGMANVGGRLMPIWWIQEHEQLVLSSYPGLWHDVRAVVGEFAEFLDSIGFQRRPHEVVATST